MTQHSLPRVKEERAAKCRAGSPTFPLSSQAVSSQGAAAGERHS